MWRTRRLGGRFNRVQYVVEAVKPKLAGPEQPAAPGATPAAHMRVVEADLWKRRDELRAFEQEYRQARASCTWVLGVAGSGLP